MNLPPAARKGKSIKEAWSQLVKWAKATNILAGPGVRLARTAGGTAISFVAPRQVFRGAFSVSFAGADRVRVGMGTIEGIEPTINGVKIGGEKGKQVPSLKLSQGRFDKEGRSWICAAVKIDSKGKIDGKAADAVTIVQTDSPVRKTSDGRHVAPLAMLRKPNKQAQGFGELHQIAYFNLRLWQSKDAARFFFAP